MKHKMYLRIMLASVISYLILFGPLAFDLPAKGVVTGKGVRLGTTTKPSYGGKEKLKMERVYPSAFVQRILTQESPGQAPEQISMVIPSCVVSNKPFALKVVILDHHGLPTLRYGGKLKISLPTASIKEFEILFENNKPAVGLIQNLMIHEKGFHRFETQWNGKTIYSNPVLVTEEEQPQIYWGDPHVHTILSNCHPERCRSLNFCYTAARYVSTLDWVAATDHVSNQRCSFDKWKEQSLAGELYNDPPTFVTLPAYEASFSGGAGGDNNVYMTRYPSLFIDYHGQGSIKDLCELVAKTNPDLDFFVVPHHTTRTGKHGEISDRIYPGGNVMPVVEIHSKWGTSEYRGNPNPLKQIHPGPSYVADFLNRGLPFGFIGGTDTHATLTFARGIEPEHIDRLPGLTAVQAEDLTRENIFQGIKNRKCYATSLERIYLDVKVSGHGMGERVKWDAVNSSRTIDVSVAAQSSITSVAVIRNGQVISEQKPSHWNTTFSYTDTDSAVELFRTSPIQDAFIYYYVRVTCASGAQAWSSPVWFLKSLDQ